MVERDKRFPALLDFYNRWHFQSWNERHDEKENIDYDQMICSLGR